MQQCNVRYNGQSHLTHLNFVVPFIHFADPIDRINENMHVEHSFSLSQNTSYKHKLTTYIIMKYHQKSKQPGMHQGPSSDTPAPRIRLPESGSQAPAPRLRLPDSGSQTPAPRLRLPDTGS